MLVSQKHGYLFIHVAKTGGTSVRAALTVGRWRDPLNWPQWVVHRASALTGHRIAAKLPRHAGVIVAQEMLPADMFATLFKFAFVRNPWDRLVSAFSHFQRERTDILKKYAIQSFPQFIDHMLNADPALVLRGTLTRAIQRPQIDLLVGLRGELLADYVGRYETLRDDFDRITRHLAIPHVKLPHKRSSNRRRDYRSAYTDSLAEQVGHHYADDLRAFGYRFDDVDAQGNDHRKTGTYGAEEALQQEVKPTISFVDHAVARQHGERSD